MEVNAVDCSKVGKLILELRTEKGMTQKELANAMNISDRTISKWERGLGCPDVSLLSELSQALSVNIEKILSGDLTPNEKDRGDMKKIRFYVCPTCGNVLFSTSEADISCCGRRLAMLDIRKEGAGHSMVVEEIENDYFVTIDHEMSKAHYISFVALAGYDSILLIKMYPEWNAEIRFPQVRGDRLFAYCVKHGLWEQKVK